MGPLLEEWVFASRMMRTHLIMSQLETGECGDPVFPTDPEAEDPPVQGPRWCHQVRFHEAAGKITVWRFVGPLLLCRQFACMYEHVVVSCPFLACVALLLSGCDSAYGSRIGFFIP